MKRTDIIKVCFVFYLTLFAQSHLQAQTTVNAKVQKILQADTIWFEIKAKGCFGGGRDIFQIYKQPGDKFSVRRLDSYYSNVIVTIDKSQLLNFGELFSSTMKRDLNNGCTLSHKYTLYSKKKKVSFKETHCGEDFQPSKFLPRALNME